MSRLTKLFNGGESKKGFFDINDGYNTPIFPAASGTRGVRELSRSDYLRLYTGWAYLATTIIADSLSAIDMKVTRSKKDQTEIEHRYAGLITGDLLKKVASYLQLNGSAYIWKFSVGKTVQSLEILRPDIVLEEETVDGALVCYKYNINGKTIKFQPSEIIAIHNFNPLQAYPFNIKGVSPMQAVAMQMEMDVTANSWNYNFFRNGGSVRDILSTDGKMSDESKDRLSTKRKNEFQGVNNAHKIAILDNNLKYSSLSPSQKEMDFVESRRFTRDEVLAIFKVPQAIAGIVENANKASATVAESTFYRICIQPLALMIQERINAELFNGDGYFRFVNILPIDTEQIEKDFNNGAITLNEYRSLRGFQKLQGGDNLKGSETQISPQKSVELASLVEKKAESAIQKMADGVIAAMSKKTVVKKGARDTYGDAVRQKKIKRTDQYEKSYESAIKIIFAEQHRDILKGLHSETKGYRDAWDGAKYISMWLQLLSPAQKDLIVAEAQQALSLVGIETAFTMGSGKLDKYMRANITKFAKSVDTTTKNRMFDIIDAGNNAGASVQDISTTIANTFDEFTKERASSIARTEVTRASNRAADAAWKESGVVSQKEWYTATDERVCEFCSEMDGTIVDVGGKFFDQGASMDGANGGTLSLDYEDVAGAPLHTNCRCTLLPVM